MASSSSSSYPAALRVETNPQKSSQLPKSRLSGNWLKLLPIPFWPGLRPVANNDFTTMLWNARGVFSRHGYHGGMNAYSVVFECPKGGHHINVQRKVSKSSLSVTEAMTMFGKLEISCSDPACGWHGKASRTNVVQIVPFNWIFAPASANC